MKDLTLQNILPWAIIISFILFKLYKSRQAAKAIKAITQSGDYQLIDVRSTAEFNGHNIPGSKNIPVDQFQKNVNQIDMNKPAIVYCASGMRSSIALRILKSKGHKNAINGGGISNVANSL